MNDIATVGSEQLADSSTVSIPEIPNARSVTTDILPNTHELSISTHSVNKTMSKLTNKPLDVDISNLTQKVLYGIPFSIPTPNINQTSITTSKIGIPSQIHQSINHLTDTVTNIPYIPAQTTIVWTTNQQSLPALTPTNPPKQTYNQVPSLLSLTLSYSIKATQSKQSPKLGPNQTVPAQVSNQKNPNLPVVFSSNPLAPGQTPSNTDKTTPSPNPPVSNPPNNCSNQTVHASKLINPIPSLSLPTDIPNEYVSQYISDQIGLPRVQKASILKLNQNSFDSHTHQQSFKYKDQYQRPSIRGSQRPSHSRQSSPKRYPRKRTDSMHSTDSRQHMDSQSSSRPQSRHTSPKRQFLNPQRYWDRDTTVQPNYLFQNQNQNQNHLNHPNTNHISYYQQNQERKHEQSNQQKPNHVQETSRRVTTIGPDGTSYQMMATSIEHDGEQVYAKNSEDIKQDRLNQLRNNGIEGKLTGTKRPNQLRLFVTRVAPDTTCSAMEAYLLDEFPQVIRAYVRKTPMFKNSYYASFVVIASSDSDTILDIEDFQSHNFPDDIKVFPGREPGEQQYV